MGEVMDGHVLESVRSVVFKESENLEGSCTKIAGYDFNKGVHYSELLKSMAFTGFQASNLGDAIQVVNQMLDWRLSDDPVAEDCNEEERDMAFREKVKCKIFLGFTSNLISSGLREIIRYLVQHHMVHVVVTTAGGVEEDLIKCLAPTYRGEFCFSGASLRSKGLNRIGNLLVPNINHSKFYDWIMPIFDNMLEEQETKNMLWTPSRLVARLGKEINDENSYLYWAYKNNIPVFCPALTDGKLGEMLYYHSFRNPGLVVDLVQDIRAVNGEAVHASPCKTGIIILGGGLPKHHICNANMMRNGADFAVFINTAQEYDGSDSGARPDEAVSWGKLRGSAKMVKVHCDATIAFPLLVAETFAQRGEAGKVGEAMEGNVQESLRSVVRNESKNLEGLCIKFEGYGSNHRVNYSEEKMGMEKVMKENVLESVRSVVFKESVDLEGSCNKVLGYDFNRGVNYSDLLKSLISTGFQASNLGDAIQVVNQMLDWRLSDEPIPEDCNEEERDLTFREKVACKIFLGFTSNLISSGIRETVCYLVQHQMVDVVVTTAGGVEEDLIKCLAPTYKGEFSLSGAILRSKGLNRIGNLLVPNGNYCKFEDWILQILDQMLEEQETKNMLWTPSRLIARLGKEINDESSYLYWAYKNNIPVFCPGLTDGSLGDMLYFHSFRNPGLVVDLVQDIRAVNGEAVHASPRKTGMIILGGGLPKHHICNANMMHNGADYAVFINTAQEFDGSDSGASPDEAVSWGKLQGSAMMVKVHCDATIAFPLLVAETFAQRGGSKS